MSGGGQSAAAAAARRQAAVFADDHLRAKAFVPLSVAGRSSSSYLNADGGINWGWVLLGTPTSPWGFLSGRYAIALVTVVIVLNRIQAICRSRGRPVQIVRWKRLAVRLPSLLMMSHAIAMLSLLTLAFMQASPHEVPPHGPIATANKLTWSYAMDSGPWDKTAIPLGVQDRTAEIHWTVFLSVVAHQITETLLATIEARRDEAVNTIGLFAFSLLLSDELPSKHTELAALLAVCESACLSLASCWRRRPKLTLPITTCFSLVGMVHFLCAMSHQGFPWTQVFHHLPDVVMINIVLMTVALQALTMLLTEGRVDSQRLLPPRTSAPLPSDSFSVALYKWGAACIETGDVANGFARELAPINSPAALATAVDRATSHEPHVELREDGSARLVIPSNAKQHLSGIGQEIRRVQPADVPPHVGGAIVFGQERLSAMGQFWQLVHARITSFAGRCIVAVRVRLPYQDLPPWVYTALRKLRLFWHGRNGELRRELRLRRTMEIRRRDAPALRQGTARDSQTPSDWRDILAPTSALLPDIGDRAASDVDLQEWRPDDESTDESDGSDSVADQTSATPDPDVDPDESRSLLDLARIGDGFDDRGDFGSVMIAHLARGDDRPLTRRRFRSGTPPDPDAQLADIVRRRRSAQPAEASAMQCAICLSDPRTIIFWPCRCCSCCESCRQSLAAQPIRGKHRCPTCRAPVEGFSRIWTP